MKTVNSLILVTAMMAGGVSGAEAQSTQQAVDLCRSEAQEYFGAGNGTMRANFKGIQGPRQAARVRLQMLPADAEPFMAFCELNTRTGEILSMGREE